MRNFNSCLQRKMLDVINIEVHFFQAPLKEQAPPYTSSPPRVLAINQSSATTRSIFQKKNRSHLPPSPHPPPPTPSFESREGRNNKISGNQLHMKTRRKHINM